MKTKLTKLFTLLAAVGLASSAWAAKSINFNVSQGKGGAYTSSNMGVLTGAANTAIGEIPLAAWTQSTTYEYGSNKLSAGNVSYSNLNEYDSTTETTSATTAGLKVKCVSATNVSANNTHSSSYPILNANLSIKSGSAGSSGSEGDGTLTFSGIPYTQYDVYVYFSRTTSNSGTLTATAFQALSVSVDDGTAAYYKGDGSSTVSASSTDT